MIEVHPRKLARHSSPCHRIGAYQLDLQRGDSRLSWVGISLEFTAGRHQSRAGYFGGCPGDLGKRDNDAKKIGVAAASVPERRIALNGSGSAVTERAVPGHRIVFTLKRSGDSEEIILKLLFLDTRVAEPVPAGFQRGVAGDCQLSDYRWHRDTGSDGNLAGGECGRAARLEHRSVTEIEGLVASRVAGCRQPGSGILIPGVDIKGKESQGIISKSQVPAVNLAPVICQGLDSASARLGLADLRGK